MSIAVGPDLINTNLILHLDPANPDCLRLGQTTCINLVSGGLVTGAAGSPGSGPHTPNPANFPAYSSINGGVFDFAGGRGMNCEEDLGFGTELSLIVWFNKLNETGSTYLTDARAAGGYWLLTNYTSRNISYNNTVSYNYTGTYQDTPPGFLNTWHMVALSLTSTSPGKLYIDGYEVSPYVDQQIASTVLGKNFRIGTRYTTSGQWQGYMGPILAYNRALSAQEIRQNYHALRGRYGV